MRVETCPHGHVIRSQADRINGYCRRCKADYDRAYYLKRKAAADVVQCFEAAGVKFAADGKPVAPADVVKQLIEKYGSQIS